MIRFSFAIAAITVISTASQLHAQQYYYPGEVIYSQPVYPIAQPVVSYSTSSFQNIPANEVPPYPIAAPLPPQQASGTVQPAKDLSSGDKKILNAKATTKPAANPAVSDKATSTSSLPTYRKSDPVRIQSAASRLPSNNVAPPVQSYSRPVIQYHSPAPVFGAPTFFPQQNCFSGR